MIYCEVQAAVLHELDERSLSGGGKFWDFAGL